MRRRRTPTTRTSDAPPTFFRALAPGLAYTGPMQLTLELPEELSAALAAGGRDPSRAALEAIALEAYRERNLSASQLRRLLGYQTRMEVDGFLKEHGVELEYTWEDLERDRATHHRLGL